MADFGLGGSTGSGTTPGGYAPNPGKQSKTGYYKSNPVPLLPSPVTRREMQRGAQRQTNDLLRFDPASAHTYIYIE